ncbi:MAG: hypothetical protein FWC84_02575 [Alphaproteobacteria bacterium]|nr:hypothetical protein [Alphaproteobacteria bacterium]
MTNIHFDMRLSDRDRLDALYKGDIFVYSPFQETQKLCALARTMIEEAFAPYDPRHIDQYLNMEEAASILSTLKPAFIHHPDCKRLLPNIIVELGGDSTKIYFDVPRMRSAYPTGYLTSGIAYAFHAHRDSWYSAPLCQINWWLPIFDITPTNCLAFHPKYFSQEVKNTSHIYNYYDWNKRNRADAAKHVHSDTREQPKLQQEIEQQDIRIICPPNGLILFSGSHLHETVPNTSGVARYSIDFRTVHIDDVLAGKGAHNVDSQCTGTTMRDYRRCTDLEYLPDEVIRLYDDETANVSEMLKFEPALVLKA